MLSRDSSAPNASLALQLRQLLRIHAITQDPDVLAACLDELCAAFEAQPEATAPKCKRCGDVGFMLTSKGRADLHGQLLALLSGPIDWTCPAEQSLLDPTSPPHLLGVAHNLAARLVAADQGLCVYCTDYIEGPAT